MRVTLNIEDKIINGVIKETGIKNKTYLINFSLDEYLKRIKRDKLKSLRGRMKIDIDLAGYRKKDMMK